MFDGVYCPSITITHEDGSLDLETWGNYLDRLADAGLNGVLIFGSIGEFYSVPLEAKKAAVAMATERVGDRMQVLAGVGDTAYENVIDFTSFCANIGVDAVLAVSPYYFGPSEAVAMNYFGGIANAGDVPVVLYNFPARTGTDLTPALVAKMAKAHPSIVGIKDTVDTLSHTRKVIEAAREVNPEFSVLSGFDEYYLGNRVAGGNGILSGLTNVAPKLFSQMNTSYLEGDFATAIACAGKISGLMDVYECCDLFISAIKSAVKLEGFDIPTTIYGPAVQATPDQEARIARLLEKAGL